MKSVVEDNVEYIIIAEIKDNEIKYLYLANAKNESDICVRKDVNGKIYPLDDEKEFNKAMVLFYKKYEKNIKSLLGE